MLLLNLSAECGPCLRTAKNAWRVIGRLPASRFHVSTATASPNRFLRTQSPHSVLSRLHVLAPRGSFSSLADHSDNKNNDRTPSGTPPSSDGPFGNLFPPLQISPPLELQGRRGHIRRTFGPMSQAQAMLVTGGEALAAHASFDPNYKRAQEWLRQHAVGPAVLSSPVLVAGLIGALVEAAFPQAIAVRQELEQLRPLIVGVAVEAQIEVMSVVEKDRKRREEELLENDEDDGVLEVDSISPQHRYGYEVTLNTKVSRVRDEAVIARGEHVVWIPDYLSM